MQWEEQLRGNCAGVANGKSYADKRAKFSSWLTNHHDADMHMISADVVSQCVAHGKRLRGGRKSEACLSIQCLENR